MKRKKNKIILTGYRATGKTSVGRLLAKKLGFTFIDTDQEIEKLKEQSISDMVAVHGWTYFREAEQSYLASLLPKENLVIAPGGGAVQHEQEWRELMECALVIWLKADVHTITKRLAGDDLSTSQRPSLTGRDMIQEVQEVLAQREPLYLQGSHFAVDTERSLDAIVGEILNLWELYQNK